MQDVFVKRYLLAFCLFIFILVGIRVLYTGSYRYIFLLWNIFLAWVPFAVSGQMHKLQSNIKWVLLSVWLLFFPNALYVVTDLMHLNADTAAPLWYDVILLFSASVLGLIFGYVSLNSIEMFLIKHVRKEYVSILIYSFLILASFGVYLGRFLRWNSWDILTHPQPLLIEVATRIINPIDHTKTWAVTLMFSAFFYLLYAGVKMLFMRLQKLY